MSQISVFKVLIWQNLGFWGQNESEFWFYKGLNELKCWYLKLLNVSNFGFQAQIGSLSQNVYFESSKLKYLHQSNTNWIN